MNTLRMTGLLILTFNLTGLSAQEAGNELAIAARGYDVYQYWCVECHGSGNGKPGTASLEYKYRGQLPGVITERTDLTPDLIRQYVRKGIAMMPFFRKTEINDADLEALATFLTNK